VDNLKVARTDCRPLRSAGVGSGKVISSNDEFLVFFGILPCFLGFSGAAQIALLYFIYYN
jgi:hypothetical protein